MSEARMTGGRIAEAGVYDMPMELYHGNCCVGPSVSGSGLVCIENLSLAHFWHRSYMNPKREEIDTTALSFGRAAHALVLGEPEFAKYFVVSPHDVFNKNPGKQWHDQWKAKVEAGTETRTLVKPDQFDAIKAMVAAIQAHPLLRNAFTDGKPEQSIIWKDDETGIWLKSRPDWLPNTLHILGNYKTTVSAKPEAFARQAFSLGYHQGAALCLEGVRKVLGWTDASHYFAAQEKKAPFVAMPFIMRDVDHEWGAMLNRRSLRKLADALAADKWPAYADGATEIAMPAWSEKLLQDRNERGEFADEQEHEAA